MTIYSQAKKEISRIKRMVKKIESRGYMVKLPPKYVGAKTTGEVKTKYSRKELASLKALKAKDVYKYATYEMESGKVVKGEVARERERSIAAKKGAVTKSQKSKGFISYRYKAENKVKTNSMIQSIIASGIINEFKSKANYRSGKFAETVYKKAMMFLEDALNKYSREKVAEALQQAKNSGDLLDVYLAYDSTIDVSIQNLANYIDSDYEYKPKNIDDYEDETEESEDENNYQ